MNDINKPVENPKLSALFEQRRNASPEQQAAVNNQIAEEIALHARLLAVITFDPDAVKLEKDGKAVIQKDTQLSFAMFTDPNNDVFMPVFTDWPSLYAGEVYKDKDVQTLVVGFDDICAITNGKAGAVVNPFTDNFVISPRNLAYMKQQKEIALTGVSRQVVEKDTTVQIGNLKEVPYEMVNAITEHAKGNPQINAVWLKLMIKDGEKSYLLIVDHTGDPDAVFKGIADAAVPHIHDGMYLDMLGYDNPTGRKAAEGTPFYRKKKKVLFS